jgi:hypothetical protein
MFGAYIRCSARTSYRRHVGDPHPRVVALLGGQSAGDTTGEAEGRLSLNPFVHLDPLGTILILLTASVGGNPHP